MLLNFVIKKKKKKKWQGKKPGQQAFSQNGVMSTCDVTHYVFCSFARRDADTIPSHVWRGRRVASLYVYSVIGMFQYCLHRAECSVISYSVVDMFQYCLHRAECSVILYSVVGMFQYCLHRAECSVISYSVVGMFQYCLHRVWKQRYHCSQSSRRVVVKLSSCARRSNCANNLFASFARPLWRVPLSVFRVLCVHRDRMV